jgi:predicted nucleic acid-binding protein
MLGLSDVEGTASVVDRLRRGIAEAGLDCTCQEAANGMLDRLGFEEDLVRRAAGLADARRMRDAIVLALALLGELDELMPDEPDRSAFQEIAGLFQDVADFAAYGVTAAIRAAGQGNA